MTTLREKFIRHLGQTSPDPMLVEVKRAEGVYFWTPEGKRYFDLISGVAVSNVGHSNPKVIEAAQKQIAEYMHVMVYGEMVERPQVKYATRIAELMPEKLGSIYFVNSGAEAVEGALKLAKRYTGRKRMISFRRAYHGSTHGAMSVMDNPEFADAYGPLLQNVDFLDFNNFDDLEKITTECACVIVEPIQGEAGVVLPKSGFLSALRDRCDKTGALLIFDEIQTGFGRTGKMFAFEKIGVTPDIVTLAKSLGGGMPLGAFVASKDIMTVLSHDPALGHITTFGGHPVCCATGVAALEYIIDNRLAEQAEEKGKLYESMLEKHSQVKEIRRCGLMMAVELGESDKMFRMMAMFKEAGILSDWFLFCDTAFRITPPLTITESEIRESCEIIISCLDKLEN